jgi:hypothetical protein
LEGSNKFSTLLEEEEKDESKSHLNYKIDKQNMINQFENNNHDDSDTSSCRINLAAPSIMETMNIHNSLVPF